MKKLFYLLLALPFVAASCENEEPITPVNDPVLTLTSEASMEFAAEGAEGIITYSLQNAKEGVELTATCEAAWVSTPVVGETITFTVAANEGEARETKVVVAYDTQSFEVTVKQVAKTEEPKPSTPVFELTSTDTLEFTCAETIGKITYKLENPVQGVEVTAKANASWISSIKATDGTITFLVAANEGAARECKITAEYGLLSFAVAVKQAEYVAPAPELTIDTADNEFAAEGGNGEIAFRVENAVEGTEAAATTDVEWITINTVADGIVSYTVATNETEAAREGNITVTYGELSEVVAIKQYHADYNPNFDYLTFGVIEAWAEVLNGGSQWDVTFVEKDTMKGEMQTIISFALAEANTMRLTSGTYSVADGTILINSASYNGYSKYRSNASEACDITDAEFTVTVDTDTKTISIVGTFQAGTSIVSLNYNGEIRGMDLGEAVLGAINHTEWASVVKNWHENKELLFTATSADGSLVAVFDFYDYDSSKALAAGTYNVEAYYSGIGAHLRSSSYFTYNNLDSDLASGSAIVEHIAGGYKITYNVVDNLGREFTGVIEGPIEGAVNP